MLLDKEKIKQSLTTEDIHLILKDLGSKEPLLDREGNPIFSTVCHGGHKNKLYYYNDSKMFHCYTTCSTSMDVFELVVRAKKQQGYECSFPQSVQYVAAITGKSFTLNKILDGNSEKIDDWNWINKFNRKKTEIVMPTYDENVLDVFLNLPHEEWLKEGISYETLQKYEIGYYIREDKISIPHRSIKGELCGLRGRAMRQEDIDNGRKYMPLTIQNVLYNHPTLANLYGLQITKLGVQRYKKALIFEGEKSVLKCQDYYGDDNFTVACCSSNLSNYHRDILLSLGVEEVFIAFDKFREKKPEESEELYQSRIIEYQERLIKLAQKFSPFVRVYVLWDSEGLLGYKDSPADKGKEVLEQLMKNKIEIGTKEVVF